MKIVEQIQKVRELVQTYRQQGHSVGLVTTMGALHEGHLSLLRRSKADNDVTVMSLFLNPAQFGPQEDLASYPRTFEEDQRLVEKLGVDLLFAPRVEEMYPDGYATFVENIKLSQGMCGAFRPQFFRGVCTVVLKLFEIVRPDRTYFGQKDAQQLRIVEKMVEDLNLNIQVIGCPTVREKDGIAMSSRNVYLSREEREIAPTIYAALQKAKVAFDHGERSSEKLVQTVSNHLATRPAFKTQYVELRRWKDFQVVEFVNEPSILAIATFLGKTRLIDNVFLTPA